MAIVDLAAVKSFIGVESAVTTYDTLLGTLLDSANTQVIRYLGTAAESAVVTDTLTAEPYTKTVFSRNAPIRDTISLAVKEDDNTLVEDTDFAVDYTTGAFTRIGGYWSTIKKAIELTYSAGFVTVPADIKLATLMQVKHQWARRNEIGVSSKTIEGSVQIDEQPGVLLKGARALLDSYRRVW